MSGERRRSGSVCAPMPPVPRGQRRPRQSGSSGLPSIFQSWPSRTEAMALHFQKQMSQNVGTVRTPPSPAAGDTARARAGVARAAAPAAITEAAEILRKRRRESAWSCMVGRWSGVVCEFVQKRWL